MTVTGPYVNLTMFEEAGVELPAKARPGRTGPRRRAPVMDATGAYAGMVMDRSGHRMAGPAMSYGAQYFDADGRIIIDDGFKTFAQMMIDWHAEGLMPPDIWPAVSGSTYANGNELFFAEEVPFYMSGSWNTGNVQNNVGDKFDWTVVPVPCGPAGCGIMPGGAGLVAFKSGDAGGRGSGGALRRLDGERGERARVVHPHLRDPGPCQASGGRARLRLGRRVQGGERGLERLRAMAARAPRETPQAFALQGSPKNTVVFNATVQYLAAAMNGELTLDEAIAKITEEVDKNANN
jgi:alpha-1,4-digalacturonate transport system substrate-binding protein